ncbi:MAG: carbohydrate binding domain-containing protein [Acholeplasmataceae bacterium]|nr:carbohydrate binding domain-containing protein [Acholeplasmataceae bacterium]
MKKLVFVMTLFFASIMIVACEEPNPEGIITWTGLEEQQVVRGDAIDLLEGIAATDSIDGDLTDQIEVTDDGEFSTHLAGGYTVTYEVTNSTGIVSTETKTFTVMVGHNVANGNFELGAFGWTLDQPGGNASVSYDDGHPSITINNAGTSWWALQLYQHNVVFQAGTTYKATLIASSPEERSVSLGYEDPNNGFAMLNNGFMPITLGTEPTEYVMYYTANENYTNVKVVVYMGNQLEQDVVGDTPHTIDIHSIMIEEVTLREDVTFDGLTTVEALSGGFVFDALTGVTISDDELTFDVLGEIPGDVLVASPYYVTYLVEFNDGSVAFQTRRINFTLAKDFEYQAINGQFENGFTGWTQDVIQTVGSGAANFTNNGDGTVSVNVTNASEASWHIQLQQANSTLRAGESYVVKVVIKADQNRSIDLEVVHPGSGFAQIAPTARLNVTTDWQTFEVHFTSEVDYTDAKIGLLLGNTDGLQPNNVTFTVDEFQIYKYSPFNSNFEGTHEPWSLDNISATVNEENQLVVVFEEGVLGDWPWNHQLYQSSGSTLVAGHTYQIDVRLKSSEDRLIRAWIEDVNKGYAGIATDARTEINLVADTFDVITYTITITEDTATTNAKFVIMFGGNFGDGVLEGLAHTVTVDYFNVTDITNDLEE